MGLAGTNGLPGSAGLPGRAGLACWDTNGNGIGDPGEDRNGDSVWDAADCLGVAGSPGDAGLPGLACWDTNGNGLPDPSEDRNGDGAFTADDCAGTIVGTLNGTVLDANTHALIQGATVLVQPGAHSVTTTAAGTFSLTNLPAGVYWATASAPSLAVTGNTVVADRAVQVSTDNIRILAGQPSQVHLAIGRLQLQRVNLTSLHAAQLHGSANPQYVRTNCVACHSDRAAEQSTVATIRPYHALARHSATSCLVCHANGVDVGGVGGWNNESAVTLRRQVNVTICTGCHACFPTSFCAAGVTACPSPCP